MGKRDRSAPEVAADVVVDAPVADVAPEAEVVAVPGSRSVKLNGVAYKFAPRKALKRAHAGLAATIDGVAGTVVVIPARDFGDNRVWVTFADGVVGRFLVPVSVPLDGALVIESATDAVAYDREALRTRPAVVRKAKAEVPGDANETADAVEAAAAE